MYEIQKYCTTRGPPVVAQRTYVSKRPLSHARWERGFLRLGQSFFDTHLMAEAALFSNWAPTLVICGLGLIIGRSRQSVISIPSFHQCIVTSAATCEVLCRLPSSNRSHISTMMFEVIHTRSAAETSLPPAIGLLSLLAPVVPGPPRMTHVWLERYSDAPSTDHWRDLI